MNKSIKLQWYSDPSHSWLKVSRADVEKLGLTEQSFSRFSYQSAKGTTYYLEEDCDLSTFATAMNLKGIILKYEEKHTNNRHPIRNYENYRF